MRGVIATPDGRLLLQRGQDPVDLSAPPYWFLPGGGVEPNESPVEALQRELLEECGLRDVEVGHLLWEQRAVFHFAGMDFDQDEQVLLVRVPHVVDIRPTALDLLEAAAFGAARWWHLPEIATTRDVIYPQDLAERLRAAGLLPSA